MALHAKRMDSSHKIFRQQSLRIHHYDYSQPGWYFVTICTKNRKEYLGNIETAKMSLSEIGVVAERYLKGISNHFPNAELDEYVVMPNHVHGIIVINDKTSRRVETRDLVSLPNAQNIFSQPIPGSLSVIVQQLKSSVKRWCNKSGFEYFSWQPNYYEHIIRNEPSLNRIREYIKNNPLQWEFDIENSKCEKPDKRYYERIFGVRL